MLWTTEETRRKHPRKKERKKTVVSVFIDLTKALYKV